MEENKVPNHHHSPPIPWQAQVREPMYGVNVNESERQSQAEMDAQQREDRLKHRRILDKAKRSLMTEQEKEAIREKRRNAYLRRKLGCSGDEKKIVNEAAETSTGRPHHGATRKAYNIPSVVSIGCGEVSSLPQSPKISEQAQHRVDEGKSTRMSTDMEPNLPKKMKEIVQVIEQASLYLMFFQTAPDEKSRSCKFCNQSYPIKTAYGNLGRHLKYCHPGYDKMVDAVSSPSPLPATAVIEKADKMGDVIPSLLPQPITTLVESAEKKDDAVPSPSPQLITTETKTASLMSDAISSPLLPSVSTVSERAQSQVKHSSTVNSDHESCNNMEPENMREIITVDEPVNLCLNSIDNVDGVFSNPPPEPITTALKSNTLLSHHLKILKDNDNFITIQNSYTLAPINNNNLSYASDSSPSLPKRGRGRPPKTNTSNNPNPKSSLNTTGGGGGVQDRSDEVVKRGRGRPPRSIAKPETIPKPIVGGGSSPQKVITDASDSGTAGGDLVPGMVILPPDEKNINGVQDRSDEVVKRGRGRPPRSIAKPETIPKPIVGGGSSPRKIITDASDSGTAGGDLVPGMVILPPDEKNINGDVPPVISTTASGRPVRRPRKKNMESFAVAAVVNSDVVKPVSSGKPVGRPRKVGAVGRPRKVGSVGRPRRAGAVGRPAKIGGGVVKKTAGRPRKVGNNLKEGVVMLLEESLGLGMNQNAPDMYLRFIQLYTIITGKEYNIALAGATAQGNNQ